MTDADFYEDLAQFMTDSMMESGFIDAEEVATKVREHDVKSGRIKKLFRLNTEAAKQNERAKVKAECIDAVRALPYDDAVKYIKKHKAIKALEDV